MPVTNDETTGRTSECTACAAPIEEALLLKGLMMLNPSDPKGPKVASPGIPRWRRLDRGPGSARCPRTSDGQHVPHTLADGSAFQARPGGGSLRTDGTTA